jgi:hypothetical protein
MRPVLASSTVAGSLMRKKLAPVLAILAGQLAVLRGGSGRAGA